MFRRMFASGNFEIVGEAEDGKRAVEQIPRARPQVVLMDVMMPRMNGIEATRVIMSQLPVPVILVSDLVGHDSQLNFKALEAGALDLMRKPSGAQLSDPAFVSRFIRSVRMWSEVPLVTRRSLLSHAAPLSPAPSVLPQAPLKSPGDRRFDMVCIGTSTGGPPALARMLTDIGPKAPWPIVMVQHIAPDFIEGMARWLAETTGIPTSVANEGEVVMPGRAYLAPDHHHLTLRGQTVRLDTSPQRRGHRPSVDALFESVALSGWASRTLAVLLTGMGEDGADGLRRIRAAGGWTIAQDAATSVVFGMPRVAAEIGAACEVLPLPQIGGRLRELGTRVAMV
jgi:two-component system, chemotaxis family, protein-glutamate methylesterase/glutaminase